MKARRIESKEYLESQQDTLSTKLQTYESIELGKHWQDVREMAAIAAMQGIMISFGSLDYNIETIAKVAVKQADALIEQLRK